MMTSRQRHRLFLRLFLSVFVFCLFVSLVFVNSKHFTLPLPFNPMIFLASYPLLVFLLTWSALEIWYWVSAHDFEYRPYFLVFQQYWRILGIPFAILIGLEGSKFVVSTALIPYPVQYYVAMCFANVLALAICLRHKSDVGRTLAQIYVLDFLNQVGGMIVYIMLLEGGVASFLNFLCQSTLIGLDLAKVIAVLTMLTFPKQQGWPSLIPWLRWRRDNPSTLAYDRLIRFVFGALMLIGMWFAARGVSYETLICLTPVILLLTLIFRQQSNTVETEIGTVSLEFLKVARDVDRITDEEYRLAVMEMVAYNTNKLVTGWVENDAIKRDKAERATKLAKDGPKT